MPARIGKAARLILSLQVKVQKSLTSSPDEPPMPPAFVLGSKTMVIETILFLAFVTVLGAGIVKVYEWRQDVLYGPYIRPTYKRRTR
jgi:hypothetical protein